MFARGSSIFDDTDYWAGDNSLTSALNYPGMLLDCLEETKQQLVKNDVVLSEGLGDSIPKQEHSYSCSIASDGDSVPSSPLSLDMQDDMESECFPCIPMKKASQDPVFSKSSDPSLYIKNEPLSPQPLRQLGNNNQTALSCFPTPASIHHNVVKSEPEQIIQVKQESVSLSGVVSKSNGQPHHQQQQSLLKSSPLTTRILCPKLSLKLESAAGGAFTTTINTTTSPLNNTINTTNTNNNNNINNSSSSSSSGSSNSLNSVLVSRQRILPAVRQTITSPLISTQLKGSSGVIYLTEEEKRTLISEGYPIPTKLPLSKAEERSLKKIRRKIKNKISAQESRRKKKEYMDSLERKYDLMQSEANQWRSKVETLQAKNIALVKQIADLQDRLTRAEKGGGIGGGGGDGRPGGGAELTYILPVDQTISMQTEQDKDEVTEFQDITSNCLDIDVD